MDRLMVRGERASGTHLVWTVSLPCPRTRRRVPLFVPYPTFTIKPFLPPAGWPTMKAATASKSSKLYGHHSPKAPSHRDYPCGQRRSY